MRAASHRAHRPHELRLIVAYDRFNALGPIREEAMHRPDHQYSARSEGDRLHHIRPAADSAVHEDVGIAGGGGDHLR